MSDLKTPRVAKLPFLAADLLMLGVASYLVFSNPVALDAWRASLVMIAVALAAVFGIAPFVLDLGTEVRLAEGEALANCTQQLRNLDAISFEIRAATGRWQEVQAQAEKTAEVARTISAQMIEEGKAFAQFMAKANDAEKARLRMEVDKLRRAEEDWLAIITRILDHIFALHQAAIRSHQQTVIDQLANFQAACRDIVRRAGLNVFIAEQGEIFDEAKHRLPDGSPVKEADAKVFETLAVGYTFQGQLLRRAIVRVGAAAPTSSAESQSTVPEILPAAPDRPEDDQKKLL